MNRVLAAGNVAETMQVKKNDFILGTYILIVRILAKGIQSFSKAAGE